MNKGEKELIDGLEELNEPIILFDGMDCKEFGYYYLNHWKPQEDPFWFSIKLLKTLRQINRMDLADKLERIENKLN